MAEKLRGTFRFFAEQSVRLLREDPWKNANDLAEELYAMINRAAPFEIDGPLVINSPGEFPSIIIQGRPQGNFPDVSINLGSDKIGRAHV